VPPKELIEKFINEDVANALKTCCSRRLHAVIVSPTSGGSVKANFLRQSDDTLIFEVRGQAGAIFDKLTPAVVSYLADNTLHVFVGAVIAFLPSPSTGTLTLTIPPFILQPDMRRFFRIPLVEAGRVSVVMEDQGYTVMEPKLIDLSAGGMLVEFALGEDPKLEPKSALKVKLQLDEAVASYLAEVRHSRPGSYGLMFVESPDATKALEDEDALKKILADLEQLWVARRLG